MKCDLKTCPNLPTSKKLSPLQRGSFAVHEDYYQAKKVLKENLSEFRPTSNIGAFMQLGQQLTAGGSENIRGIGLGLRKTERGHSTDLVVKVLVARKLPKALLKRKHIIPGQLMEFQSLSKRCRLRIKRAQ